MRRFALGQTLVTLMLTSPALAMSPAEQRGRTFALTNCARCHSIDRVTQSPLKIAPPVSNPASALPGGDPWRGSSRRHRDRSSNNAGVPARS